MWRRFFREYLRYVSRMSPQMGAMEQGVFDMMQEVEASDDFKKVFLQRSERENRKFQQFINLCKGLARLNGDEQITADHLYDAKWLFNKSLETLRSFVLPGGSILAGNLHLARAVCRRVERRIWSLGQKEDLNGNIAIYLNRLSDLLFVLARYANDNGKSDVLWVPGGGHLGENDRG